MPSEFPPNDLQNVWQNQPTGVFKVSVEKLRCKAQRLDRNARLTVLFSAVIAIVLFLFFGWAFLSFPEEYRDFGLEPIGAWTVRLGFGVLSLWSLYSGYKTYKVFWPSRATSEADLRTTLRSYRFQLEKRRDYSQNIWLRSGLIFCMAGLAMVVTPVLVREIVTPVRMLADLGPIFVLLIVWLLIFIPTRRRRQRRLRQEIDQLRAFENEHPV
jgi:hypothetical protein